MGRLRTRSAMTSELHPYYQAHRAEMEAVMLQRLALAEPRLKACLGLSDAGPLKREIMDEFAVVLHQMPYVGGAESRMTDFFMRLLGFMAIGRVLRRKGVAPGTIGEIELESFKAQLLAVPAAASCRRRTRPWCASRPRSARRGPIRPISSTTTSSRAHTTASTSASTTA